MEKRFISGGEQPRGADVIILGGGPAGTAALWAIDRAAPGTSILLIEKSDHLGTGSSTASLEAFRTCWPCLPLARQMQRSVEVLNNADHYLGEGAARGIAVKQQGYLFCAFNEKQVDGFKADVRRLHEIGLKHIELLNADEVRYRFPWVGSQVIGAKYDPMAGWLDSNGLIHHYAAQARQAKILLETECRQVCVEGGRVTGIETPYGRISTSRVIIATGAGARASGRLAGVELPIKVRPRQSFTTGWRHPEFPAHGPMLIAGPPYPHTHPEAQTGAIFGWEYAWRDRRIPFREARHPSGAALIEPVYPVEKDHRFPSLTLALLARHFGHAEGEGFGDPRYLRSLHHNAGYYVYRDEEVTYRLNEHGLKQPYESERAIIDMHPDIEGLVLSIAHAGHGIMSSPASGEIAACKVLGQPLPDPSYADFGLDAHWVEHDEAVL